MMVLSASSIEALQETGSPFYWFFKQSISVAIGVPLMWICAQLPLRFFKLAGYPLMALSIIGLVLVLFVGTSQLGAQRWIDLGPIYLQPSEPAKFGLMLWGADLLARKARGGRIEWRNLFIPLMPGTVILAVMVMLGRDLGSLRHMQCRRVRIGPPTPSAAMSAPSFSPTVTHRSTRIRHAGGRRGGGLHRCSRPVRACHPARQRGALPFRLDVGEQVQRCDHAGRAGIIGVVDDGRAVDAGHDTRRSWPEVLCMPTIISSHPHPFHQPGGGGTQGSLDAVAAQQRYAHAERLDAVLTLAPIMKAKANAFHTHAAHLVGPEVGFGCRAIGRYAHVLRTPWL